MRISILSKLLMSVLLIMIFYSHGFASPSVPSNYQLNIILSGDTQGEWFYDLHSPYEPAKEKFDLDDGMGDWSDYALGSWFILGETPVKVLKISYIEAINLPHKLYKRIFSLERVQVNADLSAVIVHDFKKVFSNFFNYRLDLFVEPVLIQNSVNGDYGVVFKVITYPDQIEVESFFRALDKYIKEKGLVTEVYNSYEVLKDKGVADIVPASIPTTYAGFKKYLDEKQGRKSFEGIWSTLDKQFTLGIFYVEDDLQFKYHAFIIDSKRANWKPGEIKVKFNRLRKGKLSESEYLYGNKAQLDLIWKVEEELLRTLNAHEGKEKTLVKEYPVMD